VIWVYYLCPAGHLMQFGADAKGRRCPQWYGHSEQHPTGYCEGRLTRLTPAQESAYLIGGATALADLLAGHPKGK
jgi:hypothetical protein